MPKAIDTDTTPALGLNRRGLLVGGAALAGTVGTVSVVGAASATHSFTPSPELVAWRHAREVYWQASSAFNGAIKELRYDPDDPDSFRKTYDNDTACKRAGDEVESAEEKLDATINVLIKRPVRSYQDVAELKELLCGEHFWEEGNVRYDNDVSCPELDALFAAIDTMAGGTHV